MAWSVQRGGYSWSWSGSGGVLSDYLAIITNTGSSSATLGAVQVRCAVAKSGDYYCSPYGSATGTGNSVTFRMKCGSQYSTSSTISHKMSVIDDGAGNRYGDVQWNGLLTKFTFNPGIVVGAGSSVYIYADVVSGSNVIGVSAKNASDPIIPDCTVKFDLDGGTRTGGGALTQTVAVGGSATAPTCTKTGYTHTGWDKSLTNIQSDTTITAKWKINTYTLTLKGNTGTFAASTGWTISGDTATKTINYGSSASTVPTLTKSITLTYNANGGTFNGTGTATSTKDFSLAHTWNTKSDGTGTSYTDAAVKSLTITSDLTLYAIYTPIAIGSLPVVGTGSAQIKERNDYRFQDYSGPSSEYWTTTQNGSTRVTSEKTILANTTIWAKWEYRIVINANGGAIVSIPSPTGELVVTDTQWKKHSTALALDYTFRNVGARLRGLSTSASATSGVGTVTLVEDTSDDYRVVYTIPASTNTPTTYYAVYAVDTYTVTFLDGYSEAPHNIIKIVPDIAYGGSVPSRAVPVPGETYKQDGTLFQNPNSFFGFQGWTGSWVDVIQDTVCEALWEFNVIWIKVNDSKGERWIPYKPDPSEPDNQ